MTAMTGGKVMAALLVCSLAADGSAAPARRPAKKAASATGAKVSASQLFLRLDSIDRRLDDMQKAQAGGAKPAPAVVTPGPEGAASREMTQAFYNYGVYSRQAAGFRMAARAIKLVTLVAGGALMVHGWTDSFDKSAPRTINNAFHDYPAFSYGLTTTLLGQLIGFAMDVRADSAHMHAARALMKPLEEQSSDTTSHPGAPAPATLTPSSTAP